MSCELRLIPIFNILAQTLAREQGRPGRDRAIGLVQRLILPGVVRHLIGSGQDFMMVCPCNAGGGR